LIALHRPAVAINFNLDHAASHAGTQSECQNQGDESWVNELLGESTAKQIDDKRHKGSEKIKFNDFFAAFYPNEHCK
jgi:hypothetical protein